MKVKKEKNSLKQKQEDSIPKRLTKVSKPKGSNFKRKMLEGPKEGKLSFKKLPKRPDTSNGRINTIPKTAIISKKVKKTRNTNSDGGLNKIINKGDVSRRQGPIETLDTSLKRVKYMSNKVLTSPTPAKKVKHASKKASISPTPAKKVKNAGNNLSTSPKSVKNIKNVSKKVPASQTAVVALNSGLSRKQKRALKENGVGSVGNNSTLSRKINKLLKIKNVKASTPMEGTDPNFSKLSKKQKKNLKMLKKLSQMEIASNQIAVNVAVTEKQKKGKQPPKSIGAPSPQSTKTSTIPHSKSDEKKKENNKKQQTIPHSKSDEKKKKKNKKQQRLLTNVNQGASKNNDTTDSPQKAKLSKRQKKALNKLKAAGTFKENATEDSSPTKDGKKKKKLQKLLQNLEEPLKESDKNTLVNLKKKRKQEKLTSDKKNHTALTLKEQMSDQLKSSRFRWLNEQLYTSTSSDASKFFKDDPEAFEAYHSGYKKQVSQWPLNPLDWIIKSLRSSAPGTIIADMGCGEALLAESLPQFKVHSFDLVASKPGVVVCDIAHTPLLLESVDIVVFCLSLMGTNLNDFLLEANRVLKVGGILKIAEVESRFEDIDNFTSELNRFGFQLKKKDFSKDLFYFMDFKKVRKVSKSDKLPAVKLEPCLYKKR